MLLRNPTSGEVRVEGKRELPSRETFRAERQWVYVSALQDAASANAANDGHYADNADKQKERRTFIAGLGCLRLPRSHTD